MGRGYRIEVVKNGLEDIEFRQRFFIPATHVVNRTRVLREWYIARAKEKIIPRVKRHAKELGVSFAEAKIVDNRYRWGSCTVNNNVNFNWRLIKAPMYVIDYAIVHELAHLMEANHTPRFWNIVRTQAPKAEQARAWLREFGQLLEQEI